MFSTVFFIWNMEHKGSRGQTNVANEIGPELLHHSQSIHHRYVFVKLNTSNVRFFAVPCPTLPPGFIKIIPELLEQSG